MKISVKLLKGEMFDIEAEESDLVSTLKEKIEKERSDLKSDRQKLIHAGKVLKDTTTVSEIGIQESDFLVCMVTKEVAKPKTTVPVQSETSVATPTAAPAQSLPVAPVVQPIAPSVNAEALANLMSMGFPEIETRAALTAAQNNADLAYEFLLTGIPIGLSQPSAASSIPSTAAAADPASIQQLRNHPQFNMLKQLIQTNPTSLPQVLNLIGAQNPALLQSIHRDEREFLAMMNEPITNPPPVTQPVSTIPPMQGGAEPSTAQMMQVLQSMPPSQRAQFAQSMGMSAEQLNQFMQMVSQLPPDQLNQMMMGQQQDAGPPGTITLTHEEMESVNRLMALGFSQQQAAQAYLACDKNETLAANFLFESGGFEDDFDDGNDDMHS